MREATRHGIMRSKGQIRSEQRSVASRRVGGPKSVATLADSIERYLKNLFASTDGVVEIRRCDIAQRFDCVPSQINYVLETRFTPQRGYYVESRRGGGGYIRIIRTVTRRAPTSYEALHRQIGNSIRKDEAEELLFIMEERGALSPRQAALIRGCLRQETSGIEPGWDDLVRAKLLKAMLLFVFHETR